jgi:hypothetical protein
MTIKPLVASLFAKGGSRVQDVELECEQQFTVGY